MKVLGILNDHLLAFDSVQKSDSRNASSFIDVLSASFHFSRFLDDFNCRLPHFPWKSSARIITSRMGGVKCQGRSGRLNS